jgi:hypothetical protein
VLVALDEPVVRAETGRLALAVRDRGIGVAGVVWNRVGHAPAPLPAAVAVRQFCAEEVNPPPIGVDAIRSWVQSWREITPSS